MQYPAAGDLAKFPIVRSFAVEMRDSGEGGQHIVFVDGARQLASFPAWDHADRDLRHFVAADVPLGTYDDPFDESDEAWRILIFEHGGHVYVLEGDTPNAEEFPRYFRVPRDQYLQAWAFVIDAFNPITPLDQA